MARSDRLFKKSYNRALDYMASGGELTTISALARSVEVSRTTIRKVIEKSHKNGILRNSGAAEKTVGPLLRMPVEADYFARSETRLTSEEIELNFMNWILHERVSPGTKISEADIVRRFGAPISTVREFFTRLSGFGFIHKIPHRHWVLEGFSKEYANEVFEFRKLFEVRGLQRILQLDPEDYFWTKLGIVREDHLILRDNLETRFLEMPEMDTQFHSLLTDASDSKLMPVFAEAISLMYHYHYHHYWDEESRFDRALSAIEDHLGIIEALFDRDLDLVSARMSTHLDNANFALQNTIG